MLIKNKYLMIVNHKAKYLRLKQFILSQTANILFFKKCFLSFELRVAEVIRCSYC